MMKNETRAGDNDFDPNGVSKVTKATRYPIRSFEDMPGPATWWLICTNLRQTSCYALVAGPVRSFLP